MVSSNSGRTRIWESTLDYTPDNWENPTIFIHRNKGYSEQPREIFEWLTSNMLLINVVIECSGWNTYYIIQHEDDAFAFRMRWC